MFVAFSGGMYVTREDVRHDQKLQAHLQRVNAEKPPPPPPPNSGIDYSAIQTKFTFAWRLFQYRYIGDPLRSLPSAIHGDDDESEDEFGEIDDCEEIQNTPIQECIAELVSSLKPDTPDSDLLASFTMMVQFAFEIAGKIEMFVENVLGEPDGGYESKFFRGIYDALMDGAKLLRRKKIMPPRDVLYRLNDISPPFEKIVRQLRGKRPKVRSSS